LIFLKNINQLLGNVLINMKTGKEGKRTPIPLDSHCVFPAPGSPARIYVGSKRDSKLICIDPYRQKIVAELKVPNYDIDSMTFGDDITYVINQHPVGPPFSTRNGHITAFRRLDHHLLGQDTIDGINYAPGSPRIATLGEQMLYVAHGSHLKAVVAMRFKPTSK